MMLQTIIFTAILAALMGVAMSETMLMAQTQRNELIKTTLSALGDNAVEDVRTTVAGAQKSSATLFALDAPKPIKTSLPLCFARNQTCAIQVEEYFTTVLPLQTNLAPSTTPQPCETPSAQPTSSLTLCNLQTGSQLAEGRIEMAVNVVLRSDEGALLGSTRRSVRLQTFALPPYALVVGVSMPGAASSMSSPGDLGGIAPIAGQNGGTLVRSYNPCRLLPTQSLISPGEGKVWGNWQGTSKIPAPVTPCTQDAGETSEFRNAHTAGGVPSSGWQE